MNSTLEEVCAKLNKAQNIAVFCHARPDGDAIGAGLAISAALNNCGKRAFFFCDDEIPQKYSFLGCDGKILNDIPKDISFDTYVSVDCADLTRMGRFATDFAAFKGNKINIDHHISNKKFADINFVAECPATCQVLTEILTFSGYEITADIANYLMLGLITDSGNFTHGDVTGKTFEIAALLREKGGDVTKINYEMFSRKSKFAAMLFARVISGMRFELDGALAFIIVRSEFFENQKPDMSITEGFVDFPLTIDGVEVSVSLFEVKRRQYKISLRSKGTVNVNAVASAFGGGGHVLASGCMMTGEAEEIMDKLRYAVYQNL